VVDLGDLGEQWVGYVLSTDRLRATEPLKIILDLWDCECSVICAAEAMWCNSATYSCLSSVFIHRLFQVRLGAAHGLQRILLTFEDCWSEICIGQMQFLSRNRHFQCLDFQSSGIQVDALYHMLMPLFYVDSSWLSLLSRKSHILQMLLDYAFPFCSWSAWSLL